MPIGVVKSVSCPWLPCPVLFLFFSSPFPLPFVVSLCMLCVTCFSAPSCGGACQVSCQEFNYSNVRKNKWYLGWHGFDFLLCQLVLFCILKFVPRQDIYTFSTHVINHRLYKVVEPVVNVCDIT